MNTTDQPNPEPGWRMLDVGEVIQEGDEASSDNLHWSPIGHLLVGEKWSKETHWPFRRRLPSQPETPSGPPDALPPKDEAQGETGTPQWAVEQLREIDPSNVTIYGQIADIIATLQRALAAAEGERATIEQRLEIAHQSISKVRDAGPKEISGLAIWLIMESVMKQRDAALAELQALKAQLLPVPQTPQEHIEDVMKIGFDRGCG